jgi:hypothetical protein
VLFEGHAETPTSGISELHTNKKPAKHRTVAREESTQPSYARGTRTMGDMHSVDKAVTQELQ